MHDAAVRLLSRLHRGLYSVTRGAVGKRLPGVDAPMLLLTTTGRRSGRPHTVPLLYLEEGDGYVVIASYGGRDRHPEWYLNLRAEPAARAQIEGRVERVVAADAGPDERDRLWRLALAAYPGYADYEARTDRAIPVVRLRRA